MANMCSSCGCKSIFTGINRDENVGSSIQSSDLNKPDLCERCFKATQRYRIETVPLKMPKTKSLRDILLRSAVVQFEEIFLELDKESKQKVVKKDICLPPKLFESIQDKSVEIFWFIPQKCLVACLKSREALHWENINLIIGPLTEEDFVNIGNSDFPVRQLSFQTLVVTEVMMDIMEMFSSTIEVLGISRPLYPYNIIEHDITSELRISRVRQGKGIKFPKLKKLCINIPDKSVDLLQRIDLSSCSDSLTELGLNDYLLEQCFYDEITIQNFHDSMKVLRNLESLFIRSSHFSTRSFDSIAQLKNLRYLCIMRPPTYEWMFINELPKLEVLFLHPLSYKDFKSSKCSLHREDKNKFSIINISNDLHSFLTFLNFSISNFDYTYRVMYIHDIDSLMSRLLRMKYKVMNSLNDGMLDQIEKAFMMALFRNKQFKWVLKDFFVKRKEHCSHEFLMKLTNLRQSTEKMGKDIYDHYGNIDKLLMELKKIKLSLDP